MTGTELDELYETADLLMKKGRWEVIDDLLMYYGMAAWRMDIDLLLGWATVTNVARHKLKNRAFFMEQCLKFHDIEPGLWKGLYEENTDPREDLKMLGFGHWIPK